MNVPVKKLNKLIIPRATATAKIWIESVKYFFVLVVKLSWIKTPEGVLKLSSILFTKLLLFREEVFIKVLVYREDIRVNRDFRYSKGIFKPN